MKRGNLIVAAVTGCVAALVVAGCGGSAGTPSSSSTGQAGGVVTFGQTAGIKQLDPNVSGLLSENVYFSLLYNGLTKIGENGSTQPDLAESWTTSANGLTWTFKLHSGVKYHSGKPFTASDAVANIERVKDPKNASQWAQGLSSVTKAVATNATTLTLTLSTPDAQLPNALSYVKMTNVADIANINKDADGTGPYELKSFVPSQSLDLVAYDAYWAGKPKLAGINIVTYPDETAAETALRNGTITTLWNPASTSIASLSAAGGLKLIKSPNPGGLDVFEVDNTSAPFNNPKARQALAYAIDRKSIIKAAWGGAAIDNPYQTFVNPSSSFFDKSLTSYAYNPQKAKELFAEAGVTSKTPLIYWTIAGSYPEMAVWGQIIQQDLAKIGITMKIEAKDTSTWVNKFYPYGKSYPGLVVSNELSFQPAPDSFAAVWFSDSGTCECNTKPGAAYDSEVSALKAATNQTEQLAALTKIEEWLNTDSPVIVIANSSPVSIVQMTLKGAWESPEGVLHLEDASLG